MTTNLHCFLMRLGSMAVLGSILLGSPALAQKRPLPKQPTQSNRKLPASKSVAVQQATPTLLPVATRPVLARGSSWPAVEVESPTSPIIATAIRESAAPEDRFDASISTPTDVTGKLVYTYRAFGRAFHWTFRDLNVPSSSTKQAAPVIVVYGGINTSTTTSENLSDLHLAPDGKALEFATYYNDFVRSYYPYQWNLETGAIRPSPVTAELSQENPAVILNEGVVWNADRSHLAYISPVQNKDWNPSFTPRSLAFASRAGSAAFLEPRTEQAFFAWASGNTLLFDHIRLPKTAHISIRNEWALKRFFSQTPPSNWPSIYAVSASMLDTEAVRKTKKAQAKLLIANAFAPIPSPDGRFVAFSGWAQPEAVAEPEPGQEPVAQAGAPQLWLWNRDTKTRTLIGQVPIVPENAVWSPDSRTLYFCEVSAKVSLKAIDVAGLLEGSRPDAASATRALGEFALQEFSDQKDKPAQIEMHGFARDRKYLFIGTREFQPRPDTKPTEYDHSDTLHALRLSDGQHQIVARWKNIESYDWLDLSTPAP